MVPIESSMDPLSTAFSRRVNLVNPNFHPEYQWHAANLYSLIYAKYGAEKTFDLVGIQMYETYGHLIENVALHGISVEDYLVAVAKKYVSGFSVNFSSDPSVGFGDSEIVIPINNLCFLFLNGYSADGAKALLWVIMAQSHDQLANIDMVAEWQRLNKIF